jgi:PPM family protein phosphatase
MAGFWRERVRGGCATRKKAIVGRANEDAVLCRTVDGLIGVFDGIGMYSEARLASRIARQLCTPLLRAIDRARYTNLDEALIAMSHAIMVAQDGVLDLQRQFPQAGDGGTTATLAKLWQAPDGLPLALFSNIGDSRLYHWNASQKQLSRLTSDDNMLRQWRDYGEVSDEDVVTITDLIDAYTGHELLPPQAQLAWQIRNTISAWLGMPEISFTLGVVRLHPGDRLLATSDGIHDNLTTEEISNIVAHNSDPRELAVNLIDVADAIASLDISPRAKPDDMAVAALFFDA